MKLWNYLAILALAATLVACSREKGPAEEAIKQGAAAVEQIRAEASKFAAEQLAQLEGQLKSAQDAFAKKEYKQALEAAGGLAAKAQEVAKAAADKKTELTARWDELQAGIPQMLEGLKSRLDILAQAKKLPADLTKEKLAELQGAYDEAAKQFEEAKTAAGQDLAKAVEAGAAIKAKAIEIAGALGLTLAHS
jgi:chromosome segregation ATPase